MDSHQSVIALIEHYYHFYNYRSIADLPERDKIKLANLILNDFDYFDPADILLYRPEKNITYYLQQIYDQKINPNDFIKILYNILFEAAELQINELFDDLIDKYQIRKIMNNSDEIDAISGFF